MASGGGGGDGHVRVISRRMVRPDYPTEDSPPPRQTCIHLTPWDLRMLTVDYIHKGILLPRPPAAAGGTVGQPAVVRRLECSFARALARFYPFAGRLAVAAGGTAATPSLAVSLRCGDEGAEFVHAAAPGVTAADVADALYIPPVVWSFFPLGGLLGADAVASSSPVLAAQVTELDDGVFVAMSLNHGVADGTTFWHLFNTWSEISRLQSHGEATDVISTPPPVLERWFLDGCPVPIHLPFRKLEDLVGRRVEHPPVQECFLHFSVESVKKLKAKANAELSGTTTATVSSLQAVLAHLWRAVCRARRLSPDQVTTYTLLAGCRGRVEGVPAAYAGNAVTAVVAESTAGEILGEGLGWAARLLNRAVASFDEARARDQLASWPRSPTFMCLASFAGGVPTAVGTGSSPRFDVFGNDFGWGRPVAVRSGPGNKVDGKATVYEGGDRGDGGGGGSMALEVCLAPDALARLVADEEFMSAVTTPPRTHAH